MSTVSAKVALNATRKHHMKLQSSMPTKGAQLDEFTANIATGSGSSLPAIYGSESMQDKDAVIILRRAQEIIAFPGEGGYKIQWSPGTKLCPMTPAPSGHLVVQCDHFDDIRNDTDRAMTYVADHTRPTE